MFTFWYAFCHLLKRRTLTDTKYDIVIGIQIQIFHDASHLPRKILLHFLILDEQGVWVFSVLPPSQIPLKPILQTTCFVHTNKLREAALEISQYFHRFMHVVIRHEHIFDIPHNNNKLGLLVFNCVLEKFCLEVWSEMSGAWHVVRVDCVVGANRASSDRKHIFPQDVIVWNWNAVVVYKVKDLGQPVFAWKKQQQQKKSPGTCKVRYTVYPKKYAHGFVVLCFVVVMQSFIMNSHEVFTHIHQGWFAGTGAIVRLQQCQWSKPDGYGIISQCITTTKHSKAKTVCIFLGIYCYRQIHTSMICCRSIYLYTLGLLKWHSANHTAASMIVK